MQLGGFGLRGTGHPGELAVEPEVVLQRDGGQRLVLLLDLHAFLGLDRLVHSLVVAPAGQHPASELVDDQHFTVTHDVVPVALVELLGLERIAEVTDQRCVGSLVEVVDAQLVLDELDARLGDRDGALALLDLVVVVALHPGSEPGELRIPALVVICRPGDDQRGARLIDQDRVDLVDHREVVTALDQVTGRPGHVVAQVVEAELVVGAVGDVAGIAGPPGVRGHIREDLAYRQPQEPMHPTHPVGVSGGQIVVHGDHVHAAARQRIEVGRQRGDQGLALTGLHLGDIAQMHRRAAHQLDVVVELAQGAAGSLAHHGERLRQQLIEGLAVAVALFELLG